MNMTKEAYDRRISIKRSRYKANGKWSRKYDKCIRCRRNIRPHVGNGLCSICYYYRNIGRNKK